MESLILVLAFVCPGIFGAAMATIAHYLVVRFGSSIRKVLLVLTWFVGNGGILAANGFLFRLFEGIESLKWGDSLITLGYLAGFGFTILYRQRISEAKFSGKKLLEAFFLLYGSGASGDKQQLCIDLGVNETELAQLNEVIIGIFAERSRQVFQDGHEGGN